MNWIPTLENAIAKNTNRLTFAIASFQICLFANGAVPKVQPVTLILVLQ